MTGRLRLKSATAASQGVETRNERKLSPSARRFTGSILRRFLTAASEPAARRAAESFLWDGVRSQRRAKLRQMRCPPRSRDERRSQDHSYRRAARYALTADATADSTRGQKGHARLDPTRDSPIGTADSDAAGTVRLLGATLPPARPTPRVASPAIQTPPAQPRVEMPPPAAPPAVSVPAETPPAHKPSVSPPAGGSASPAVAPGSGVRSTRSLRAIRAFARRGSHARSFPTWSRIILRSMRKVSRRERSKELFRDEIKKSYDEYVGQVGADFARSTTHFQESLNEVLGAGRKIF